MYIDIIMKCPVCTKEYSLNEIEDHVENCLSLINVNVSDTSVGSKRFFPFEDNSQNHPSKKHKSSSMSTPSMEVQKAALTKDHVPLTEKMRPASLAEYIGQETIVGFDTVLQKLLKKGHIPSMILWGPPGCGKTSLANVISRESKIMHGDKLHIIKLSAASAGISSIKEAVNEAKKKSKLCQTVVFMDEIHRFNKLQQDIFLPHVEAGTFTLVGTTTENPSYSLNSALLSRCRVFVLNKLTVSDVTKILCKATDFIQGQVQHPQNTKSQSTFQRKPIPTFKPHFIINAKVIDWLAEICNGDARVALNSLELAVKTKGLNKLNNFHNNPIMITFEDIKQSLKQTHMLNDKQNNDSHHIYSALHKSIKAGKANASLYWLARIMAVKEDPVNIARRLVRISSEDVGLADPDALGVAVHTMHGCQMIGMPECDVLLGQCVIYLAKAPKSRLMYNALNSAKQIIINHKGPQPSVPIYIRCRSGEGKLQASLGRQKDNLFRKEDDVKTYLPESLRCVSFFSAES